MTITAESKTTMRISALTSAFSYALDLAEGQPMGHAVRSCVLGMRLAKHIHLPRNQQTDLYHALLMKDAGCSSNSSQLFAILGTDDIIGKRDAAKMDWTKPGWMNLRYAASHVATGAPVPERVRAVIAMTSNQRENTAILHQSRANRGAMIARRIGLSETAASAIYALNEHWNGRGEPSHLAGEQIPMLSRIMNIAQVVDVFYSAYDRETAIDIVRRRSGTWFDPTLVKAFLDLARREHLWWDVMDAPKLVASLEPDDNPLEADDAAIDRICLAFAEVIDAKSPFTYRHSNSVAKTAVDMARRLALPDADISVIRRAALLHDIGRLGVPNTILEKPERLTDEEAATVREHTRYCYDILGRIPGFERVSKVAASPHERLDGTGYFRGLSGGMICMPSRVLAVAHMHSVLSARRPFRDALPLEEVLDLIQQDVPHALDAHCFEALKGCIERETRFRGAAA